MRRARPDVEGGVVGHLSLSSGANRCSRIQIAIIARKIAPGDLYAEAMPYLKHLRRGLVINLEAIHLSWVQEGRLSQGLAIACPENPIADRHGAQTLGPAPNGGLMIYVAGGGAGVLWSAPQGGYTDPDPQGRFFTANYV